MIKYSKEILNKPNELISIISSAKKITLIQRKAYNSILKNAQNMLKFENHQSNMFKIEANLLHKKSNLQINDYKYLKDEIERLMGIVVSVVDKENPKYWKAFNLLSYIELKDDGFYHYELNQFIIKSLKEQTFFTPLNLLVINSLSSQYSIIFYELAIRYNKFKIPKMSIKEVRQLTNTEDQYKAMKDFRKYVLDKACEEISKKTDIILTYETEKKGRRIAFIDFEIEIKPNGFDAVDDDELEHEEEILEDIPEIPVLSFDTDLEEVLRCIPDYFFLKLKNSKIELIQNIEKYLKEYDKGYIKHYISYCKKNKDTIRYYDSYLISAIDNNYEEIENKKQKEKEAEKKIIEEKFENLPFEKQSEIILSCYNSFPDHKKEHIKKFIANDRILKEGNAIGGIITFITSYEKEALIKFYMGE